MIAPIQWKQITLEQSNTMEYVSNQSHLYLMHVFNHQFLPPPIASDHSLTRCQGGNRHWRTCSRSRVDHRLTWHAVSPKPSHCTPSRRDHQTKWCHACHHCNHRRPMPCRFDQITITTHRQGRQNSQEGIPSQLIICDGHGHGRSHHCLCNNAFSS